MIGKPVSDDELLEVLRKQRVREIFTEDLEEELKGIKQGQCLQYEVLEVPNPLLIICLTLIASTIKGLRVITEERSIYVYKE